MSSRIYLKECALHHLGSDLYDGAPNSQLKRPTEGISIARSFYVNAIPSRMPKIRFFARGIQHPTERWINGIIVNHLGNSNPNGDLSLYDFQLSGAPQSLLKLGSNMISIMTAAYDPISDLWDEIEFCSLALYE